MRSADDQRTTYYQTRAKALANAATFEEAEIVRLQAEAVALATAWTEYQALADQAMTERESLPHGETKPLQGDVAHTGAADTHHE